MQLSFGIKKKQSEKPKDEEVIAKLIQKPTPPPPVSKLASKIGVKKPQGQSKKPERWTPEEHTKFIEAVRVNGKNWKKVAKYMDGGRDPSLLASHSQQFRKKIHANPNIEGADILKLLE